MRLEDIVNSISQIAPLEVAAEWDSNGLQIAFKDKDIKRIMTCLEITEEVMKEAIINRVDLIVSHHPLIFGGIHEIDSDHFQGRKIIKLIQNEISVYAAHTSFDFAPMGNNDYLAQLLGLTNVEAYESGLIGYIDSMKLDELVDLVGESLSIPPNQLRVAGQADQPVRSVAICSGAGGDFFSFAMEKGADVLLTGDVKYHQAQDAISMGKAIIDAGHYGTEKFFGENMASQLAEALGSVEEDIEIIKSNSYINPFRIR